MKQVTLETVRRRIADLACGSISLREEFELACLRQLLEYMEAQNAK